MSDRDPLGDGNAREHADLEADKSDTKLHKGVSHGLNDGIITDADIDNFVDEALPGDDV